MVPALPTINYRTIPIVPDVLIAVAPAGRPVDWAAAEAFVSGLDDGELFALLDTPAPLEPSELGAGLEPVRAQLRADVAAVREAAARRNAGLTVVRTAAGVVYAPWPAPENPLFRALERLRWSGALGAAGLDLGDQPGPGEEGL
jgi:hypothetical protein